MLKGPFKEIKLSVRERVAVPYWSLSMFPRSPTCLTESEGAPWVLPYGLKCVPVDIHPSLRSPRELLVEFKYPTQFNVLDIAYWTWKPRKEEGSRLWISPEILTGPSAEDCSNVIVPVTGESPFSTTTACASCQSQCLKCHH